MFSIVGECLEKKFFETPENRSMSEKALATSLRIGTLALDFILIAGLLCAGVFAIGCCPSLWIGIPVALVACVISAPLIGIFLYRMDAILFQTHRV